jgi:hypothetical protein
MTEAGNGTSNSISSRVEFLTIATCESENRRAILRQWMLQGTLLIMELFENMGVFSSSKLDLFWSTAPDAVILQT